MCCVDGSLNAEVAAAAQEITIKAKERFEQALREHAMRLMHVVTCGTIRRSKEGLNMKLHIQETTKIPASSC